MRARTAPIASTLAAGILAALAPLAAAGAPTAEELQKRAVGIFRPLPKEMASPDNPVTDTKITLGRMLYYDPRLSKSQTLSCNSCHLLDKAGVDNQPTSEGHRKQRGDRNALRALALVRDQAGSLPDSVGTSARLYAWLNNTSRRLVERPMAAVWRFVWAFAGAFLGFAFYAWVGLTASPGWEVLIVQIYAKTVTTALTVAFFTALRVIVADEIWQRLRGFWPAWSRALLAFAAGLLMGMLMWTAFTAILLEGIVDTSSSLIGGVGIAISFGLMNLFRMPGWLSTIVTFAGLYAPALITWNAYTTGAMPVPLIYVVEDGQLVTWLVPAFLLAALGINAQALWRDVRGLRKRG